MICQENHTQLNSLARVEEQSRLPAPLPPVKMASSVAAQKKKAKDRRYYLKHRARQLAKSAEYAKRHPDRIQAARRQWRERHRDQHNATGRKWRKKNRAHCSAVSLLWQKNHPEQARAIRQKSITSNRTRMLSLRREWSAKPENAARLRAKTHEKRLARLAVPTSPDARIAISKIVKRKKSVCFYCGKLRKTTVEHIKPLSRGGHHSAANLVGACWKCNHSKNAKLPNEFIKNGQLVLL
jgi:5-methylcytosine-specific restriction endonuclease McrA